MLKEMSPTCVIVEGKQRSYGGTGYNNPVILTDGVSIEDIVNVTAVLRRERQQLQVNQVNISGWTQVKSNKWTNLAAYCVIGCWQICKR